MKKMILLAVIALLVLGGGFFAYKWFAGRKAPAAAPAAAAAVAVPQVAAGADDEEDEPAAAGGEKEGGGGPAVLQLSRLIVNLDSANRKNAFLKCDLHILFRDPDLGKAATSDKPTPENSIIRAVVLEALSGKTVEEASDVETRETVRQDIKDKLNAKFANHRSKETLEKALKSGKPLKPPVKDVLVVDWAIQQ